MTLGELRIKALGDLGETPSAPVYYTSAEVVDALNEGTRALSFLTLCYEETATLAISGAFTAMDSLSRLIVPLRVLRDGQRVSASSLTQLVALGPRWAGASSGTLRYAFVGSRWLVTMPASGSVQVVHAASPPPISSDSQTPLLPDSHHIALVDYAVGRLRMKEGSQEFARGAARLNAFVEAARDLAVKVRARSRELGYDRSPVEFDVIDLGRILRKVEKQRAVKPD